MSNDTHDETGPAVTDGGADLVIGRIGPARGVHGEVLVEPWTDDPDERFAVGTLIRTDPVVAGPLRVRSHATISGRTVLAFDGVEDRVSAEGLRGVQLVMAASERPELQDEDDFYDSDLVGLTAFDPAGEVLGPVVDVQHAGPADYLVLEVGGRPCLVPFVAAIVPVVDVAAGRVTVDAPPGLFEL